MDTTKSRLRTSSEYSDLFRITPKPIQILLETLEQEILELKKKRDLCSSQSRQQDELLQTYKATIRTLEETLRKYEPERQCNGITRASEVEPVIVEGVYRKKSQYEIELMGTNKESKFEVQHNFEVQNAKKSLAAQMQEAEKQLKSNIFEKEKKLESELEKQLSQSTQKFEESLESGKNQIRHKL